MHRNVERLIGRLATDRDLRTRFAEEPWEALREQGLELNEVEVAALAATDPAAIHAFADALDARLRKASLATESRPSSGETTTETESDSKKEIEP